MADLTTTPPNSNTEPRTTYMLTTVDNPFDPFEEFDTWLQWDAYHGYHTSGFLARVAITSDELSEADQALAIQQAIEIIVKENVLGLYKKVSRKK